MNTLSWPTIWKSETVNVIPKNSAPSGLQELRNLSCTPLFSKILESFILDRLKKEVVLSPKQYGGIKGSSTDHFLTDTWDRILTTLEDPNKAVNLISVDFSKAFNRMDHYECLGSLAELGASQESTDWVVAFLFGRTMSVKIGNAMSTPREVPGGSPQGSILGNFLFCATTNKFTTITDGLNAVRNDYISSSSSSDSQEETDKSSPCPSPIHPTAFASSTPSTRGQFVRFAPNPSLADLSGSYESEDESFDFFRQRKKNFLDTTVETDDTQHVQPTRDLRKRTNFSELESFVYIDDYNSMEGIITKDSQSHITTRKRSLRVHAPGTERLFAEVGRMADGIGMVVNDNKTQMLCLHPAIHNNIASYINTVNGTIESGQCLKILGFTFDRHPNATCHVKLVIDKFYSRLWTLRFLRKSKMDSDQLLEVYKTVLRPAVEYASVVYDSIILEYLSNRHEQVQRQALRIIYGWHINVDELMIAKNIETLKQRRTTNVLKFAIKTSASDRFGPKWYTEVPAAERAVRQTTRGRFVEKRRRTERGRQNPIDVMTRMLNERHRDGN